ncbi:MAG: hypothetical protein U1E70_08665 [Acetobacteraceae bacterium]
MFDRSVFVINPASRENESARQLRFSDFLEERNIILLGDPGAGKTHLFNEASQFEKGHRLDARAFLNIPTFSNQSALYIDGLDERRAGRGDRATVDDIVRKLFSVAPAKLRISCRIADWLGETDLAAFRPYYDMHGGVTVLGLKSLSDDEQRRILLEGGLTPAAASTFIEEAEQRGISEYLGNPQNLLMLLKAVQGGDWPETRKDLYSTAVRFLIAEVNKEHLRSATGAFSGDELRETAGAFSAARLIADVVAIGLSEDESIPDVPTYRSLSFVEAARAQAALQRRVFRAGPIPESVDYLHRTTAEFLGAEWLALRVRAGLPFGRVRALLGVEGVPAPELRGLHAWLAAFLPEHAEHLIDADPYGVLAYGDAAALSLTARRYLLQALDRLSQSDPLFRAGQLRLPSVGALARADMLEALRGVLASSSSNLSFRLLVVEALAVGHPITGLQADLAAMVERMEASYAERTVAAKALLRLGTDAKHLLAEVYRRLTGTDKSSIRLRADIIGMLYGEHLKPGDVAVLLEDTLASADEVPIGALYPLIKRIPPSDVPSILEILTPLTRKRRDTLRRRNISEICYTTEGLMLRFLKTEVPEQPVELIWRWLELRRSYTLNRSLGKAEDFAAALQNVSGLVDGLIRRFLSMLQPDQSPFHALFEFREAMAEIATPEKIIDACRLWLQDNDVDCERNCVVYSIALVLTYTDASRFQTEFAELFMFGEDIEKYSTVRDSLLMTLVPDYIVNRCATNDAEDAEAESSERRRQFEDSLALIRTGEHLGWLEWSAQVYLGQFHDVDRSLTPRERLAALLGPANAGYAIEGLRAVLQRPDLPTATEIAQSAAINRMYRWWYAIVAGMDETWAVAARLDDLPDSVLLAAMCVAKAYPTTLRTNDGLESDERQWIDEILLQKNKLAFDVYYALAHAGLLHGSPFFGNLWELLNNKGLIFDRAGVVSELLKEFPEAGHEHLDELIRAGLACPATHALMIVLARLVIDAPHAIDWRKRDNWIAAAYLLTPAEYQECVSLRIREMPQFVFLIRKFMTLEGSEHGTMASRLGVNELQSLISVTASVFPYVHLPDSTFWGDTNAWDASDFVQFLINLIAANPTNEASEALRQLRGDPSCVSYDSQIGHAAAEQNANRVRAQYDRPNWRQTICALENGTPANQADLHALVLDHLRDIASHAIGANTDIYKFFWNEGSYGKTSAPKPEESCRDVLVEIMRPRLVPFGIMVEPEGHMASDKRADILVAMPSRKVLCELKRDYHAEVWRAAVEQLDRFYTIDPDARGYGIYVVFWFGAKRPTEIPAPPRGTSRPASAKAMEAILKGLIPADKRGRLSVVVLDVSGENAPS